MADGKIFRVETHHKTMVFVDSTNKLVHKVVGTPGDFPIYAKQLKDGGLCLFGFKNENINFIASIKNDSTVELKNTPVALDHDENDDGTITLKNGKQFWSARSGGSNFGLVPRNLSWEHLSLSEAEFIPAENLFTVRTIHKTRVIVDSNNFLHHKPDSAINVSTEFVLCARRVNENNLSFFVVKNGLNEYVSAISQEFRVILSDKPASFPIANNMSDDSIAIFNGRNYMSAISQSDSFRLAPHNQGWEHYFLDKVLFAEKNRTDVVLIVLDAKHFDEAFARLKNGRGNIAAIFVNDMDERLRDSISSENQIPILSLSAIEGHWQNNRGDLWFIYGSKNSGNELASLNTYRRVDENAAMAAYLQHRGIPRENIINISIKTNFTPTWTANLKYLVDNRCSFFVTGGIQSALAFDIDQLLDRNGVNLAADGQDLRQSYFIARHVFEHAEPNTIEFVLIGLSPHFLNDGSIGADFSKRWIDCQYIFNDGDASDDDKLFYSLFNDETALPKPSEADPNLSEFKELSQQSYDIREISSDGKLSADVVEANLRSLEQYVQLCVKNGAKPIGVLLPFSREERQYFSEGMVNLARRMLRQLDQSSEFTFIDLYDLPLGNEFFSYATRLNVGGARAMSIMLNDKLRERGVASIAYLRRMTYDQLYNMLQLMNEDEYNSMMDRIFAASVEAIKGKDQIKVGIVMHSTLIKYGEPLRRLFERSERYETTIFYDEDVAPPKQDVLIFLMPHFAQLPRYFRDDKITAETLIAFVPYGFETIVDDLESEQDKSIMMWKFFVGAEQSSIEVQNSARKVFSGNPKMDAFVEISDKQFDWKLAQADAIKIVWAPSRSIGETLLCSSTFQSNHKFMYEYARDHSETSWAIKVPRGMSDAAVNSKVFPSKEAFDEYIRQWDALPNARVVTDEDYQPILASSDGMILDDFAFVAEYQYAQRPMLFLTRGESKFNELGQAILDVNYNVKGDDLDGIAKFIADVLIARNDPKAEARRNFFDQNLNYQKVNGLLAAEMIFRSIDQTFSR